MKISVIVPTYKPKDYLWECLDSLVAQTLPGCEWELLLVLNGCCEPWHTQIEQYIGRKMQGMNVVFVQTDTPGVSNARNIALDRVRGEYVTFIDDDDYVSPQYLEELLKAATPDTVSLCYPYAFDDGHPEVQRKYSITDAYEYCAQHGCGRLSSKVRKFFSGPCMKLIPMSFIQERRYDVRFAKGEDSLFMFLISDRIKRITLASRTAVYYRRYRENSAVTRKLTFQYRLHNVLSGVSCLTKYYLNNIREYDTMFFIQRVLVSFMFLLKK